jgi:uncharacterized membrane protein (DUF4010 family)
MVAQADEPGMFALAPQAEVLLRFGVALVLGILVGLEREHRKDARLGFAGVRTIALIALLGAVTAWVGETLGLGWITPAAFGAIALLVLGSYVVTARGGSVGITTEVTALIAFVLGVLCERGEMAVAGVVAIAVTLLLVLKDWLHALARKIETSDIIATLQFAIVTVVVLPLVPDKSYGPPPFDVLNPYRIWLMVALISAIDFASWLLVKFVGREHGIELTGLLGGLASSTATTLSFTKRSRAEPAQSSSFALAILIAWSVMVARVAVVVGVTSTALLRETAFTLAAIGAANLVAIGWLWRRKRERGRAEVMTGSNPFELRNAIRFGLLFGVVIFAARAAEVWLGEQGLYLAGVLAGLTDVDAVTLSMSQLAGREPEMLGPAGRAVALALVSNTLAKGGIAAAFGSPALRHVLLPIALGLGAVGAGVAFLT